MMCTSSSQADMTLDSVMEIPLNESYVTFGITNKKREISKIASLLQKSITILHMIFFKCLYFYAV